MPAGPDELTIDVLHRIAPAPGAAPGDGQLLDEPPAELWARIEAEAFAEHAQVVDLATRRTSRSRTMAIVGAVAAATVLIAGVTGLLRDRQGTNEVVASADLSLLAGGGSGTAEMVQRDDGLYLVVDVDDLAPAEQADFYELWLLAPDVSDMASMARFETGSGEIEVRIPDGVDPTTLPVVDISEEIDDGDDTHSGLSILRGELT